MTLPTTSPSDTLAPPGPLTFAKGFRGGMVLLPCEIHTTRARQFYRRHFEQLSRWLSGLERARHLRDVDARLVDEAESTIAARLRESLDHCQAVARQLAAERDAGGLGDVVIQYTTPACLSVPIIHPQARTCLDVLLAADGAFAAIERQWLLGLVDTRQRRGVEGGLRRALQAVAAEVRAQYGAMARVIRAGVPRDVQEDAPSDLAGGPWGDAAWAPTSSAPATKPSRVVDEQGTAPAPIRSGE